MKTLYSIILLMLVSILGYSQTPEAFNYQAVIRNASGDILTNSQIAVQVSILQNSESGTAVYVERFNPTTNDYGLITLKLGMGSVQSGTFNTIDWGADSYYIKIEVDPNNGTAYTSMGTSQLLSVPYALHAKTADISGSDPVFIGWDKNAADDFDGAFSSLSGIPAGLSDGDDNSQLNETQVEAFIDGDETSFNGWDKNTADDFDGAFSSLTGIPPGLSDGDDNSQLNETQVEAFIDGDETSFNGWDKNTADDFSGDYNDLTNNPDLSNMISITSPQEGDIVYYSSGNWVRLPRGTDGQSLYLDGGSPIWRNYGSTHIQGYYQFVTFRSGFSSPIAFGFISSDGSILSGTGNFTCSWNAGLGRYEITITGHSYLWTSYSTVVTLSSQSLTDGAITRVGSVSGMLLIFIEK